MNDRLSRTRNHHHRHIYVVTIVYRISYMCTPFSSLWSEHRCTTRTRLPRHRHRRVPNKLCQSTARRPRVVVWSSLVWLLASRCRVSRSNEIPPTTEQGTSVLPLTITQKITHTSTCPLCTKPCEPCARAQCKLARTRANNFVNWKRNVYPPSPPVSRSLCCTPHSRASCQMM